MSRHDCTIRTEVFLDTAITRTGALKALEHFAESIGMTLQEATTSHAIALEERFGALSLFIYAEFRAWGVSGDDTDPEMRPAIALRDALEVIADPSAGVFEVVDHDAAYGEGVAAWSYGRTPAARQRATVRYAMSLARPHLERALDQDSIEALERLALERTGHASPDAAG